MILLTDRFPRGPDLLVLDLDGVLADSEGIHRSAFRRLWAHCGVPPPPYEEIAGLTTEAAIRSATAALHPTEAEIREWTRLKQDWAIEASRSEAALFEDVRPFLSRQSRAGRRLALATGASRRRCVALLESTGIRSRFGAVLCAEDVASGKPAPDLFLAAVAGAGGRPDTSLVVEDSRAGLLAAEAAGIPSVSVRSGAAIEADGFLGSCGDLLELAEALGDGRR